MSNLLSLIKIEFAKSFSGLFSRKNNKPRPILFIIILVGLLSFGLSFLYNFIFIMMIHDGGLPIENGILLFASFASMMIFISSINQARSIYIGDDYELLASLPIKKRDIISSKIFNLYIVEFLFSMVFMVPNGIIIVAFSHNVGLMMISFMLAIVVPIVPIAIASLLSLLITMATARFKYGNIISFVFYALFIAAISLLGFVMRSTDPTVIVNMSNVVKWFNPSLLILELAFSQSMLFLLVFVGANILLLLVTILVFALLFDQLHTLVTSIRMKNVYVRKELKIQNEFKSLLSLEFKRLVNTKMYFINAIMGPLMAMIMIPLGVFSTLKIKEDPNAIEYYYKVIVPAAIATSMWVFSMSNPSASSISIEGKTFWISKTLPISLKKYMYAKLLLTYIIYIPSSIIVSTIIVVFFHFDALGIITSYLLPLVFILASGLIGLICNVKHPKFKWRNEQEVCKNSAAVGFTMLWGSIVSLGVGTHLIVLIFFNPLLAYLVALGELVVILIICWLYLNSIFFKKIDMMEDF